MPSIEARLGLTLCLGTLGFCAVLHIATFITIVPFPWLLPPFVSMFGAVVCARAIESDLRFQRLSGTLGWRSVALLVYAVLTFIYFYTATGGASSVDIVNGQYVSMYKSRILRTITEQEFRMFPNLGVRVVSAWIAMMAAFWLDTVPLDTSKHQPISPIRVGR